jgi:hypothetical protein
VSADSGTAAVDGPGVAPTEDDSAIVWDEIAEAFRVVRLDADPDGRWAYRLDRGTRDTPGDQPELLMRYARAGEQRRLRAAWRAFEAITGDDPLERADALWADLLGVVAPLVVGWRGTTGADGRDLPPIDGHATVALLEDAMTEAELADFVVVCLSAGELSAKKKRASRSRASCATPRPPEAPPEGKAPPAPLPGAGGSVSSPARSAAAASADGGPTSPADGAACAAGRDGTT